MQRGMNHLLTSWHDRSVWLKRLGSNISTRISGLLNETRDVGSDRRDPKVSRGSKGRPNSGRSFNAGRPTAGCK